MNKRGNEVETVKDGAEAKAFLKKEMVDCVIADIMMPNYNGIQLLKYIRNTLKSDVPVIMISALENDDLIHDKHSDTEQVGEDAPSLMTT